MGNTCKDCRFMKDESMSVRMGVGQYHIEIRFACVLNKLKYKTVDLNWKSCDDFKHKYNSVDFTISEE